MPSFTLSETVALRPGAFVSGSSFGTGTYHPLSGDAEVGVNPLAEAVLQAALLGLEADGALRLRVEEKKRLFGLLGGTRVVVERAAAPAAPPPAGSLEAELWTAVADGPPSRDATDLLVDWLATDRAWPQRDVLDHLERALHERGLADEHVEEGRVLFVKTRTVRHTLAETARDAVAALTDASAQALFSAARTRGLLDPLTDEVRRALKRRTEQDNSGDWPD